MTREKVFISYSHQDNRWRERIVSQLRVLARQNLIDIWDDTKIRVGSAWLEEIHQQMLQARIAILLISASFLSSDFILDEEIPRLFTRHEQDGMLIYPLLIRPCPWKAVPWLARMQIRPEDGRPVSSFR